ncbi:Serine incorporator (Serinc) [Musa troglodytarum]|uniref:Serine incorporator (Serinc) n=1 Tax=Musa troglodytarum TaxID=320322 RepID=A0A9E7FED7_9LILI|nr:Serine incorporator (Serinc) [Musa troglodytarum]
MWAASCLASCCATCTCGLCTSVAAGISRRSARLAYCGLFALSLIISWILREVAAPLLKKIPWINTFTHAPPKEWFQTNAVLRVSLGNFLFFAIFALLMIRVKDQNDKRDSWHHGGWIVKIIIWALLIVLMFFLPNIVITIYETLSKFGSGFFLLVQVVILLDFTHTWNDAWVEKDEQKWYVALLSITVVCYLATYAFSGVLFMWFNPSGHDCGLNVFFIVMTMILAFVFAIVALHPQASHVALVIAWQQHFVLIPSSDYNSIQPIVTKSGTLESVDHKVVKKTLDFARGARIGNPCGRRVEVALEPTIGQLTLILKCSGSSHGRRHNYLQLAQVEINVMECRAYNLTCLVNGYLRHHKRLNQDKVAWQQHFVLIPSSDYNSIQPIVTKSETLESVDHKVVKKTLDFARARIGNPCGRRVEVALEPTIGQLTLILKCSGSSHGRRHNYLQLAQVEINVMECREQKSVSSMAGEWEPLACLCNLNLLCIPMLQWSFEIVYYFSVTPIFSKISLPLPVDTNYLVGSRSPLLEAGDAESGKPEKKENEARPVSYSYTFFHLIFALASMYSAMLLTGWSGSISDSSELIDVGWTSVWVRICTEWATAVLYIWTLVAPLVLPDREFY